MVKRTDDYAPLPPPAAGDTFLNTKTRRKRVVDGRSRRPTKGLVQLNVKVVARARTKFEDAYEKATASAPKLTKGEFVEMILAAYEAQASKSNLVKVAENIQREPVPPPADRAAGRLRPLMFFATSALAKALQKRSDALGWTLSETIEHACAVAAAGGKRQRSTKK